MTFTPFAYGVASDYLVATDALEVFACSAGNQNTLWTFETQSPVVGVRTTRDAILVLESAGKLTRLQPATGGVLGTINLGSLGVGLAATATGRWAAVTSAGVTLGQQGAVSRHIEMPGATHAALAESSELVAFASGDRLLLDDRAGPFKERKLSSAITGLAWRCTGDWLVTTAHALFLFSSDHTGVACVTKVDDMQLSGGVASPNGHFFAVRLDNDSVAILAERAGQVGMVKYYQRTVGELEFGPHPYLGIGIGQGDGNRISILSDNAIERTDPPADRQRNHWVLAVKVHPEKVKEELRQKPEPIAAKKRSGCFAALAILAAFAFAIVAVAQILRH